MSSDKIGISGDKGSGKSTLADDLVSEGYREYSFADPIKRLILDIFQIDPKYVHDPAYKEVVIDEIGVSARELLQVIGTELFRDRLMECLPNLKLRGGSVWIHSLLKRVENDGAKRVVVSDVRFRNEYNALAENDFLVVKIERPGLEKNSMSNHVSEQGCPNHLVIINNSTPSDMIKKLKSAS